MNGTPTDLRVLFITRAFPPAHGGMQRFAADFYDHLSRRTRVDLVANSGGKAGMIPFVLRSILRLALGGRRYGIVHLYDAVLSPLIPIVGALSGAKVTLTVNGLDIVYGRFGYQHLI